MRKHMGLLESLESGMMVAGAPVETVELDLAPEMNFATDNDNGIEEEISQTVSVVKALESINEAMEKSKVTGGLNKHELFCVNVATDSICKTIDISRKNISVESYVGSNYTATMLVMESISELAKVAMNKLKELFTRFINWIKSFFVKSKKDVEIIKEKIQVSETRRRDIEIVVRKRKPLYTVDGKFPNSKEETTPKEIPDSLFSDNPNCMWGLSVFDNCVSFESINKALGGDTIPIANYVVDTLSKEFAVYRNTVTEATKMNLNFDIATDKIGEAISKLTFNKLSSSSLVIKKEQICNDTLVEHYLEPMLGNKQFVYTGVSKDKMQLSELSKDSFSHVGVKIMNLPPITVIKVKPLLLEEITKVNAHRTKLAVAMTDLIKLTEQFNKDLEEITYLIDNPNSHFDGPLGAAYTSGLKRAHTADVIRMEPCIKLFNYLKTLDDNLSRYVNASLHALGEPV